MHHMTFCRTVKSGSRTDRPQALVKSQTLLVKYPYHFVLSLYKFLIVNNIYCCSLEYLLALNTDHCTLRILHTATYIRVEYIRSMTSPYKYLIIENVEKLRKITINNPKRKNALPLQAYEELTGKLLRINWENQSIGVND